MSKLFVYIKMILIRYYITRVEGALIEEVYIASNVYVFLETETRGADTLTNIRGVAKIL